MNEWMKIGLAVWRWRRVSPAMFNVNSFFFTSSRIFFALLTKPHFFPHRQPIFSPSRIDCVCFFVSIAFSSWKSNRSDWVWVTASIFSVWTGCLFIKLLFGRVFASKTSRRVVSICSQKKRVHKVLVLIRLKNASLHVEKPKYQRRDISFCDKNCDQQ